MTRTDIINIISTLLSNGFHLDEIQRFPPQEIILNIKKFDKLGAEIKYSLLFSSSEIETTTVESLIKISQNYGSTPILISDNYQSTKVKSYKNNIFYDFFGGIVNTGLVLLPNLPLILESLGINKLPEGLIGEPFDLHELYIKECLQFLLNSPTRRYGKDRLFESLPDGLVLCKNNTMILYDSKAYSGGFDISADDIKRFSSYVQDFNKRYSALLGQVFTFTVITGHFNQSEKSLRKRSTELYQKCGCQLSCLTSKELGLMVQKIQTKPNLRASILWEKIFSETIININLLEKEIIRVTKDKLI